MSLRLLERLASQNPEPSGTSRANPRLRLLERRMKLAPLDEKQPVVDAVEQPPPRSPRVRELMRQFDAAAPYTGFKQLPTMPKAPRPSLDMKVYRDGAGQIAWCEISDGTKIKVLRDGAGLIIGAEEVKESPVLPAPDIDENAEARKYNPGTTR